MKLIILLSLTFLLSSEVYSQTVDTQPPLYIITADGKRLQLPKDGDPSIGKTSSQLVGSINTDWIDSMDVLKGNNAVEKYGQPGQNGVVVIKLKKGFYSKLPGELKKYEQKASDK